MTSDLAPWIKPRNLFEAATVVKEGPDPKTIILKILVLTPLNSGLCREFSANIMILKIMQKGGGTPGGRAGASLTKQSAASPERAVERKGTRGLSLSVNEMSER